MDYLNYGNKVEKQSQKPQPQGFGNQVQLTKDDFSFGDLNQQTTQPQSYQQLAPPPHKNQREFLKLLPKTFYVIKFDLLTFLEKYFLVIISFTAFLSEKFIILLP